MAEIRGRYPEIFERCRETFACFLHSPDPRKATEVTAEEREALWEKLYGNRGFGMWQGNFRDILVDRKANAMVSDFVARKIRQRVKDQAVAEKLIPTNHGFGTRRVPLETKYYEVYNQPNVKLVDIKETPIERITPDRTQDQRRRLRVRHHHLCHGLRRHHRRLRPHRLPGRRRAQAQGQVEGRPADLSRHHGRRLPQHDDADGPAHRAGQHPAQHRIQRRMGHRHAQPCARARHHAHRSDARGRAVVDRPRQVAGRRAACPTRSIPG